MLLKRVIWRLIKAAIRLQTSVTNVAIYYLYQLHQCMNTNKPFINTRARSYFHFIAFLLRLSCEMKCIYPVTLINLPVPNRTKIKNLNLFFSFTLLCGISKGFMKVLNAFLKPFKAPQSSVKTKINVNLYFNNTF